MPKRFLTLLLCLIFLLTCTVSAEEVLPDDPVINVEMTDSDRSEDAENENVEEIQTDTDVNADSIADVNEEQPAADFEAGNAVTDIPDSIDAETEQEDTVIAAEADPQETIPTMSVDLSSCKIGAKETHQLTVTFSDGNVYPVTYTTSKKKCVSVSETGLLRGGSRGTAEITVSSLYGTVSFTVTTCSAPKKVSLNMPRNALGVGEVQQISASLPKKTASFLTYTSSNESVAVIESDESGNTYVRAVGAGSVTIGVSTFNGKHSESVLTVYPQPDTIGLSVPSAMGLGEKMTCAAVLSAGAVTYASDNPGVIGVDAYTGTAVAYAFGSANITVTAYNGVSDTKTVTVCNAPSSITVSETERTIYVGDSYRIETPAVAPEGSASATFTYTSSKKKYAAVTADGLVTAKRKGKVVITVTAYNGVSARINLKIIAAPKSVSFGESYVTLAAGKTIKPTLAGVSNFTLVSSDSSVVEVLQDGRTVRAVGPGTVNLTGTSFNNKTAVMTITVPPLPTSFTIRTYDSNIGIGDRQSLYAGFENGEDAAVTWFSDDESVASIDSDGTVTAVSKGKANITCTAVNGVNASIQIRVCNAPTALTLIPSENMYALDEGPVQLNWTFGADDEGGRVSFSSSNESVASVNAWGVVSLNGEGTAVITGKTYNGISSKCYLQVGQRPGAVSFTKENFNIVIGDTVHLPVVFDIGCQSYKLKSDDPAVADVSGATVKAVSCGTANITLTTSSGLVAGCSVTVCPVPESAQMNVSEMELIRGTVNQGQLSASASGIDVMSVKFVSDDPSVAEVDEKSGVVTLVGFGSCTVEATCAGALKATCTITARGLLSGHKIGLDPGHQSQQNKSKEKISPDGKGGSKKKVSYGAGGKATRIPEYKTNLNIGLKLRDMLEYLGAEVVMTRTVNEVNISNQERAKLMNAENVEFWLRLHCNSSSSGSHNGTGMYIRKSVAWDLENVPEPAQLLEKESRLARTLQTEMCKQTGFKNNGVTRNNSYTGNNWSKVPCVLVEMGYDSNRSEDKKLNDDSFQYIISLGMVNGICTYLGLDIPTENLISQAAAQ